MYEDSRADWTLEQHTASLACSVNATGSAEWAACRKFMVHHLEYERLQREVMAVIDTDLTGRVVDRLSRQQSRAMKMLRMALRELKDLQTERWRQMVMERQRERAMQEAMREAMEEETPPRGARRRERVC